MELTAAVFVLTHLSFFYLQSSQIMILCSLRMALLHTKMGSSLEVRYSRKNFLIFMFSLEEFDVCSVSVILRHRLFSFP